METFIAEVVAALKKRRIECSYAADRREAAAQVLELIARESSVGIGGTMTVQELEIEDELENMGCKVWWHWRAKPAEMDAVRRATMNTDVYLSSANAITKDGRLVNIDGMGNRVASMVFGPKKVVIIAGKNKITTGLDEALERIKQVACVKNAQRLERNTPCGKAGICTDCSSPERMCNITTIIEGKPAGLEMHVILVGEDLGY